MNNLNLSEVAMQFFWDNRLEVAAKYYEIPKVKAVKPDLVNQEFQFSKETGRLRMVNKDESKSVS